MSKLAETQTVTGVSILENENAGGLPTIDMTNGNFILPEENPIVLGDDGLNGTPNPLAEENELYIERTNALTDNNAPNIYEQALEDFDEDLANLPELVLTRSNVIPPNNNASGNVSSLSFFNQNHNSQNLGENNAMHMRF